MADFIGESTFLPVRRSGDGVSYNGSTLSINAPVPDAESLVLLLRPERLRILTEEAEPDMNRFDGTVTHLVYQGDSYLLNARLADGTEVGVRGVTRRDTIAGLPQAGRPVTLGLHADDTLLVADE